MKNRYPIKIIIIPELPIVPLVISFLAQQSHARRINISRGTIGNELLASRVDLDTRDVFAIVFPRRAIYRRLGAISARIA